MWNRIQFYGVQVPLPQKRETRTKITLYTTVYTCIDINENAPIFVVRSSCRVNKREGA